MRPWAWLASAVASGSLALLLLHCGSTGATDGGDDVPLPNRVDATDSGVMTDATKADAATTADARVASCDPSKPFGTPVRVADFEPNKARSTPGPISRWQCAPRRACPSAARWSSRRARRRTTTTPWPLPISSRCGFTRTAMAPLTSSSRRVRARLDRSALPPPSRASTRGRRTRTTRIFVAQAASCGSSPIAGGARAASTSTSRSVQVARSRLRFASPS
jgi:hypothetical protein